MASTFLYRYHRRLRRAQRRQEIKDIEKLVEGDPDLAQEKLQQLDEERAVERATLKVSHASHCQCQYPD
jgi:flagellar biosynthesis protein FlhB